MKKHRGSGAFLMLRSQWQWAAGFPKARRVQAPSAPGFYRSCASRRTMGSAHRAGWFRGSYIVIAAAGSCIHESKRVQGASMDKTVQPPWRAGKNKQTALTGVGNAPLLPPAAASSPEGQILAGLCLEGLMSTEAERRANFPLRGGKGTGFVGSRRRLRIQ